MTSKPKYKLFAEFMEKEISSEKYTIDDYLPGERQLSNESSLSRVAVRMGLKLLLEKGLLNAIPGKGYKVSNPNEKLPDYKSKQIGVIFAGPQSNYPSNLMTDGIFEILHDSDYQFVFASCQLSVVRQRRIIKSMVERGIDGLLVVPEYRKNRYWEEPDGDGNYELLKKIHDNGTPVVLIDRSLSSKGLPCVSNDDFAISGMSVNYLAKRGHQQIVAFQSINTGIIVRKRYEGYVQAVEELGLSPMVHNLDKNASQCLLSSETCRCEFRKMLSEFPEATGFIIPGALDLYFQSVLSTFRAKREIEYICTDQPVMNYIRFVPFLERPMRKIGHLGAEKIIKLLHGKRVDKLEEYLKPKLVTEKSKIPVYTEI